MEIVAYLFFFFCFIVIFSIFLLATELGGRFESRDENEKQTNNSIVGADARARQPWVTDLSCVFPEETVNICGK